MTVLGTVQVSQMKFASGSQLLVTDSQGASMIRWLANFRGINADAGGAGTPTYRMHVGDAYECEYANMVPICFGKEAIGSDDAALSLKHNYSAVIRVPDNCAITDLQINYSGNKSAGTLTAQVYKEGSPIAGAVVGASTGTNATGKKRFSPFGDSNTGDNLQFKRGERLEIKYTSSGMSTSGGDVSVTAGVVPWAIELS